MLSFITPELLATVKKYGSRRYRYDFPSPTQTCASCTIPGTRKLERRLTSSAPLILWFVLAGGLHTASAQSPSLNLSSTTAGQGSTAITSLAFTAGSTSPAGLEWTLAYPANQITGITASAGAAATAAGKSIVCASASGVLTCLMTGLNTTGIGTGTVANFQVTLASNATSTSIAVTNPMGVAGSGTGLPSLAASGGVITITTLSSVTCNPASLNENGTSTCTTTITQAAPAGGTTIALASNNSLLTVPASVTVPSAATSATFAATASATIASNQSATVTATLGSNSQTTTISLQAPVLVSSLTCTPTGLGQNESSACTLTLNQSAPSGGSTVTLSSNNSLLTVPTSTTVTAGATSGGFTATAAASIGSNQTASITATINSTSQKVSISLLTEAVSGVSCSPSSLGQSASSTCTVTLTKKASSSTTVTLASNNGLLTVPSSVAVAKSATTATFTATAGATIPSNQSALVTATLSSSVEGSTISLLAPVLVSSVACNPNGVMSGTAAACTATLSQTVTTNTTVSLSSSSTLLSVPSSVTVASGTATGSFNSTGGTISASSQAVVTATLGTSSQTATLSLWQTPTLTSLACTPTKIAVGSNASCTVSVSQAAGTLSIAVTTTNTALTVPATVAIAQGSSSAAFTVSAASAATGWIVLTTAYNAGSKALALIITQPPSSPDLKNHKNSGGSNVTHLRSLTCTSQLRAGVEGRCEVHLDASAVSDPTELQVTSSSPSVHLPSSIKIRRGQSVTKFCIDAIAPVTDSAATITVQTGTETTQASLALDMTAVSMKAPTRVNAVFGAPVEFRLTSGVAGVRFAASSLPAGAVLDPASGMFQWTPDDSQKGVHEILFTATAPPGDSASEKSTVEVGSGTPVIARVVNAASHSKDAVCSPGAIGRIEGKWLTEGVSLSDPTGNSTRLSGTSVRINGAPVPLLSVSASQVDFLCPAAAPGVTLDIALQTSVAAAQTVQTLSRQAAPGIFSLNESGNGQGVVLHSGSRTLAMVPNYQYDAEMPMPGDSLTIYATGIDPTAPVSVVTGGMEIAPQSVSAVKGMAGVYQLSVTLPEGLPEEDIPVSLKVRMPDGSAATSNKVVMASEISK